VEQLWWTAAVLISVLASTFISFGVQVTVLLPSFNENPLLLDGQLRELVLHIWSLPFQFEFNWQLWKVKSFLRSLKSKMLRRRIVQGIGPRTAGQTQESHNRGRTRFPLHTINISTQGGRAPRCQILDFSSSRSNHEIVTSLKDMPVPMYHQHLMQSHASSGFYSSLPRAVESPSYFALGHWISGFSTQHNQEDIHIYGPFS
jgi:hypothetical protein